MENEDVAEKCLFTSTYSGFMGGADFNCTSNEFMIGCTQYTHMNAPNGTIVKGRC